MTPRSVIRLCIVQVVLIAFAGCVKNVNLTPPQQAQVNLYKSVQAISIGNRGVVESMIALNKQGLVGEPLTRAVLEYSRQVNDAERAALVVLESSNDTPAKAAAVLALLKKLNLPPAVAEFLNSSPTAAAVLAVVKSIVSIQQVIASVIATPASLLNVEKVTP